MKTSPARRGHFNRLTRPDATDRIVEYYAGLHPRATDPVPALTVEVTEGQLRVTYRQASSTANVEPVFEWSTDLRSWLSAGITIEVASEIGPVRLMRAALPTSRRPRPSLRTH